MSTRSFLCSLVALSAYRELAAVTTLAPATWPLVAVSLWVLYAVSTGWQMLSTWDKRQLMWGILAAFSFHKFLQWDPSFQVTMLRWVPTCHLLAACLPMPSRFQRRYL